MLILSVLKPDFLLKRLLPILAISIIGILAYSNTFHASFHFDDHQNIVENPVIKNLSYFIEPSKANRLVVAGGYDIFRQFKSRLIGYLTFALDYKIHGLDVTGYHVTNLIIHIANALLVYILVVLMFKTPFMQTLMFKKHAGKIALISALLFVSHPVQTEAVIYILQRFTSLATLFYLVSFITYLRSRLSRNSLISAIYYVLSLLFAAIAMKTKEIAFTLPILITLFEFMFFQGNVKKRIALLVPLLLTMIIIPLSLIDFDMPLRGALAEATRTQGDISHNDYFITQLRVVVTYLRLLILPVNQNLDYDYPLYSSFFSLEIFSSFLLLVTIFCLGVYLVYRSRSFASEMRLVAFGIFWFFITLSVESSLITLADVIFEHRIYLPSIGFFIAALSGIFLAIDKYATRKIQIAAVIFLIITTLILVCMTYARNNIWQSEISLWKDTVKKSPKKARPHNNLGNAYLSAKQTDKAMKYFQNAIRLNPVYAKAQNNLGAAYIIKGDYDKGIEYVQNALIINPTYAEAYNNLGFAYLSKGLYDEAINNFETALMIKPDYIRARNNLEKAFLKKGEPQNQETFR